MKKTNLILFLLFSLIIISKNTFGQNLTKTEREYFILGTLSDYMGRITDPRDGYLLDRYDATQGPLVKVVDSILRVDYPVSDYKVERYADKGGTLLSYKIFSKVMSEKLNAYYDFKPSRALTADNDPLLNNKPIMMGMLKQDLFKTHDGKLAFLAGVYVRYGVSNGAEYEIDIANSVSKAKICYELLLSLNVKTSYQIMNGYIPVGHEVFFTPDARLKAYLQKFMYLRNELRDNENSIIQGMIKLPKKK